MNKGKVAILVDPGDSFFWDGPIHHLEENGWQVELLTHQSWFQPTSKSPLPKGAEVFDVLIVYAMRIRNWWVEALTKLNKPTVYISTIGRPNLVIEKLQHLDGFYRWADLLAAVEKVAA